MPLALKKSLAIDFPCRLKISWLSCSAARGMLTRGNSMCPGKYQVSRQPLSEQVPDRYPKRGDRTKKKREEKKIWFIFPALSPVISTPSISVEIFLAREIHVAYHLSIPVISVFKSKSSFSIRTCDYKQTRCAIARHLGRIPKRWRHRWNADVMISDVDASNYAPRSVPAWTERTNVGWAIGHYPSAIRRNTLVAPFFRFYVAFNFLHAVDLKSRRFIRERRSNTRGYQDESPLIF